MSLKVGIVGTAAVGKTHFINRLENKKFVRCYIATAQYDIRNVSYKDVDIEFRDFGGCHYIPSTSNDLFIDLDVLLLMIDDSKISYTNGKNLAIKIMKEYQPKRLLLVQNKIDKDVNNDGLRSKAYKISVKNNEGIEELMDAIIN